MKLFEGIENDEKALVGVVRRWLGLLSTNPRTTFYIGLKTTVITLEGISLIQTSEELNW